MANMTDSMDMYEQMVNTTDSPSDVSQTTVGFNGAGGTFDITLGFNGTMTPPRPSLPPVDPWFHTVRFICEVAVSLPLAVLGIIGNIVAFIVLCRQKQRLTTNVLLQALAVADTLVLISTILVRSLRYVGWEAFNDVHHYIFMVLYPCVYFFRLADTWITVMLTIDRYIAVCHPLHAQRLCTMRRTYISLAVITLATLVFSIPRAFEYQVVVQGRRAGFMHTDLVENPVYMYVYKIGFFFAVMYLIPMAVLIVLNICLMCTLRQNCADRRTMMSDGCMHNGLGKVFAYRASRSVTIIVATVVIVCVVCNVIAMTTHVFWSLHMCIYQLRYLSYYRRYLANVSNIMITFNCAINFLIYCMFSRKFRACLRHICSCQRMRRLSWRWRFEHSDTSGAGNASYSSMGLLSYRMSVKSSKKQKTLLQQKISTDL